jgi:hypothetical protein
MSLLSDSINLLASNVFGGTDISVSLRKSPIERRDNSPLATLEGDPYAFSSISYPRDVTYDMQNGHYMLFYINVQNKTKYFMNSESNSAIGENVFYQEPVDDEQGFGIPKNASKFVSYGNTEASYKKGLIDRGGKGTIQTSDKADLRKGRKGIGGFENIMPTTTRITDSIAIYLPPNVKDATSVGYNNAEMGIIGAAAAGSASVLDALRKGDMSKLARTAGGAATDLLATAGLNLGSEFIGTLAGVDPEGLKGFAKKAFGQASNPYMEVLFEGVELRTFTYNFTFSPRNSDETDDVQKIIEMFRFHMLPELNGGSSAFMTLPSTFDIHYMYQVTPDVSMENNYYTKIATCVLKGCDVDYAPNGVKSFASGAPTQITMSLSFQETEMLTKQHVNRGY